MKWISLASFLFSIYSVWVCYKNAVEIEEQIKKFK